ncbi:MAG: SPASM domain-containing protein [bacterium]|nr:SPASM domain-containing protein [bacterium]
MLRTSRYTMYIDLPDHREEVLLVHGYTGAYDKVSRRVADYLRSLEAKTAPGPLYGEWSPEPEVDPEVCAASEETIAILKKRGYLTRWSCEAEEAFFAKFVTRLHERAAQRMPSYLFMPTYDCNLRCSYCFQDSMRTDSAFRHLLRTMQPPMVDRIFAAMPKIEARHQVSAGAERRDIGFFGGEPLLAAHRPIVETIMDRASKMGEAAFWAVTNGTELDAFRDLLGPGGIARLQITLDGPPREHDRRRIYPDGSGSFERIAGNVTMALDLGTRVTIRVNVDQHNLTDLPQVAEEIVARRWHRRQGFSAYTAPIQAFREATGGKGRMSSRQLDRAMTEIRGHYPKMAVLGRPDEGIRVRARRIFSDGKEVIPRFRPSFCGAHDRMYIFDPFGHVYACWEKTGDPRLRIAGVTPEGDVELRPEQDRWWRDRTVAGNPVCRRCRYALYCGGGCAVLGLEVRGKLGSNYCDGFASRFRASIAEAYLEHVAKVPVVTGPELLCDL